MVESAIERLLDTPSFPPRSPSEQRHHHRRSLTEPCILNSLEESTLVASQDYVLPSSGLLATTAGTSTKRCGRSRSLSDTIRFRCTSQSVESEHYSASEWGGIEQIMMNNNKYGQDDKLPSTAFARSEGTDAVVDSAAAIVPSSVKREEQRRQRQQEVFHTALLDEEWKTVDAMLETNPSLASKLVPLTLQGEDTVVFPLAAAAACCSRSLQGGAPISLLEAFVTAHPTALLHGDSRGNRVPLMIALMTLPGGTATAATADSIDDSTANRRQVVSMTKTRCIRYLLRSWSPKVLKHLDSQGNVALHYGARYCSSTSCGCRRSVVGAIASASAKQPTCLILEEMISAYPDAAQVINHKQQLPLHLLVTAAVAAENASADASLCCNTCTIRSLKQLIEAYPQALQHKDRQGRLPLHVACASSSHPSWDVLQVLIDNYPAALACEDGNGKIPLELWVMMSPFRTGIVGSVAGLSLRASQRKKARKRALGAVAAAAAGTSSPSGDNDVILGCLQECTRREQDKKQQEQHHSRFLGRVLSGLRGSSTVGSAANGRKKDASIMASFNNCYG